MIGLLGLLFIIFFSCLAVWLIFGVLPFYIMDKMGQRRIMTVEITRVERDLNKDYLVHHIIEDGGEVVEKFGKDSTVIYYTLNEGEPPHAVIHYNDNSIQIYVTQDTEIP